MKKQTVRHTVKAGAIFFALMLTLSMLGAAELPALLNPKLDDFAGGLPKGWLCDRKLVSLTPVEGGGVVMKALVESDQQGAFFQNFKSFPGNTRIRLAGYVKSSKRGAGFLQLKLYKDGKETGRFNSKPSSDKGGILAVELDTGNADAISVYCRMFLEGKAGETVLFKDLQLGPAAAPETAEVLEIAPGFAGAGLYLNFLKAAKVEDFSAQVKYRELPAGAWRDGFELTYHPGDGQARGVLANLRENASYEVAVDYRDNGRAGSEKKTFTTLAATVPIAQTVFIEQKDVENGLVIADSGTAAGYIRYTARPGVVLKGPAGKREAILLDQIEYVILENLTLEGGGYNGITVNDCNHVRILNCDISRYGTPRVLPFDTSDEKGASVYRDNGVGINNQAGVSIRGGSGVVLERNFIHDPKSRANSWFYAHPAGPNAVFVGGVRGLVMRYNDFVGADLHRWNDASEGLGNGEIEGGPWKDAEIYGNYFAFGNDDGIELDGGQINCRLFRNKFEGGLCGISTAPCLRGPSFVFDNLVVHLRDELGARNVAIKDNFGRRGDGKIYLFNNLISVDANAVSGFGKDDPDRISGNIKLVSRNNVLHAGAFFAGDVFREKVSLDYDLLSPFRPRTDMFQRLDAEKQELHALRRAAPFAAPERGDFRIAQVLLGEKVPVFAPEGRIGNDLVLPERPLPFVPSASEIRLDLKTTRAEIMLEVTDPGYRGEFRIVQPAATDYFRVTPAAGVLVPGKPVKLTVESVYGKVTDARINSGAFLIRTASGLSRPVSVYLDSRQDVEKVKARRASAIYGKVEQTGGKCKLVFELEKPGKYYLFGRFKSRVGTVALDGMPMQVRSGDAEPGEACWGNIGYQQGKTNAPLEFKAGRNVFEVTPRLGQEFELWDCALGAEPEMFLYAPGPTVGQVGAESR
ncbi:MAG: right-handed parallel beta-helix repeat-containing protein [Victivallaceae bacterium]